MRRTHWTQSRPNRGRAADWLPRDPCADAWRGLEPLEPRLLLSTASLTDFGVASLTGPAVLAAETVTWQGTDYKVAQDRWIVRLADDSAAPAGAAAALKSLAANDVAAEAIGQGLYVVQSAGHSIAQMEAWAAARSDIIYVEPDFAQAGSLLPSDTSFNSMWGLNNTGQSGGTFDADIDAVEAWNIETGSSNVVIGIVDTGIDITHTDLAGNIWVNPGEIAGNGVDDDGNGYIDDIHGWDFINDDNNPEDNDGHGTHVAGTIGAVGNNAKGTTGVVWDTQLMALKFLDPTGFISDAIEAINYATDLKVNRGINVVATNNSWGGGGYSQGLFDAIAAHNAADILFIAAAGNGGSDGQGDNNDLSPFYPATYPLSNIIAVAASDRNDNLASFSNYGGASVDLTAPGVSVLSTRPGNNYGFLSGTSMATPHVSGVVALLKSAVPSATGAEIRSAILSNVDPIPAFAGLTATGGRLNALGALNALIGEAAPTVTQVTPPPVTDTIDQIMIDFSEPIDAASVSSASFSLVGSGADGTLDTGDDVAIAFEQVALSDSDTVTIDLFAALAGGNYRLTTRGTGANAILGTGGTPLNDGEDDTYFFTVQSGPFEPNDTIALATDTGIAGPAVVLYAGNIGDSHGARDVDLFHVSLGAGVLLTVALDAIDDGTNFDGALRLFNAAGTQLAVNSPAGSTSAAISYTAAASGDYYVGVSGSGNTSYNPNTANSGADGTTGNYDLRIVSSADPDASDFVLEGNDLTLGINSDGTLVATSPFPVGATYMGNEFFDIAVPQASMSLSLDGQVFQNNSPAQATPQMPMTVTDMSAGTTLHARAVSNINGLIVQRDIVFEQDANYATVTMTLLNSTVSKLNSLAWLENLNPDQWAAFEPDFFETANDVRFEGRYIEAAAHPPQYSDGLTFAIGSADDRAVASSQGSNIANPFDVINAPQDPDGVTQNEAVNLAFDLGDLDAGEQTTFEFFYIFDTTAGGARTTFATLAGGDTLEPNDTLATALDTQLATDTALTISATIGDGSYDNRDVDIYHVTLTAGETLVADIDASELGSSLDSYLRIFNALGQQLAANDDQSSLDSRITFTAPSTGDYYIGVSGYNNTAYNPAVAGSGIDGSTGTYDIELLRGVVGDALEPNNTPGTATDLGVITAASQSKQAVETGLSIHSETDVDWFVFTLSNHDPETNATITFSHANGDLDMALYNNPTGVPLRTAISVSDNETIELGDLPQGVYYLEVYGWRGATNDYNLSVDGPPPADPEIEVAFESAVVPDNDTTPSTAEGTQFGTVTIGQSTIHNFAITNVGGGVLNLTGSPRVQVVGLNAADFEIVAQPGASLGPNESMAVMVRFTPSAAGTRYAALTVSNSDSDEDPYNFAIRGVGMASQEIAVLGNGVEIVDGDATPTTTDHTHFGTVDVGSTVDRTFTIQNTGLSNLTLTGLPHVQIVGAHASDFEVITQPDTVIAPGGTTDFTVRFTASAANTRYAAILIENSDSDENPYNFAIRAEGMPTAEIAVSGNTVDIADGDTTPTAGDFTRLGDVAVGGSIDRTFTISNAGGSALLLSGVPAVSIVGAHAADFAVISAPATTVAAGASTTFTIRFTPSEASERYAAVTIANNDTDEQPFNFAIRGGGLVDIDIDVQGNGMSIADGDTTPSTDDHTAFGSVALGNFVDRTFTIANGGSSAFTLTGSPLVQIVGAHAADFAVIDPPDAMVPAGGTTTFTVRFTPSAATARYAGIIIANEDDNEGPYNFSIRGTGTVAPMSTAPDTDATLLAAITAQSLQPLRPARSRAARAASTDPVSLVAVSDNAFAWLVTQLSAHA